MNWKLKFCRFFYCSGHSWYIYVYCLHGAGRGTKTLLCHGDCEFWCIAAACSWICQRVNVGGEGLQFTYERGGKLYFQLYFSGVAAYIAHTNGGTHYPGCIFQLCFSILAVFLRGRSVHTFRGTQEVFQNCIFLGLQFTCTYTIHCIQGSSCSSQL